MWHRLMLLWAYVHLPSAVLVLEDHSDSTQLLAWVIGHLLDWLVLTKSSGLQLRMEDGGWHRAASAAYLRSGQTNGYGYSL